MELLPADSTGGTTGTGGTGGTGGTTGTGGTGGTAGTGGTGSGTLHEGEESGPGPRENAPFSFVLSFVLGVLFSLSPLLFSGQCGEQEIRGPHFDGGTLHGFAEECWSGTGLGLFFNETL